MSIKEKIINDLKNAMKAGDTIKRDTLRMADSMIKNAEIEKMKKEEGLNDEESLEVIAKAVKQRKDSAIQYEAGGRSDLAEKENKEIEILMEYLPEQMNEEDIRKAIIEVIVQAGAKGEEDIGKVMGMAMGRLKGKADGSLVKKITEEELGKIS